MDFSVSASTEVNFAPKNETEEIVQNVRTILASRIGTAPLYRDFGITWEHLDKPMPVAKALMRVTVIEAIEEFEPRAKVRAVEFDEEQSDGMEGILSPRVIISIGDDEEDW